jgi:hypothetical protein
MAVLVTATSFHGHPGLRARPGLQDVDGRDSACGRPGHDGKGQTRGPAGRAGQHQPSDSAGHDGKKTP